MYSYCLCKTEDVFFFYSSCVFFKRYTLKIYRLKQLTSFSSKLCVYFEIMCILFCYLQDEKIDIGYELILLSNRDEDFQRPAKQAHVWKDTKYALGGSNFLLE